MADYVLAFSDEQDTLLQQLTKKYNLEHDTQVDVQTFIGLQVAGILAPFAEAFKQARTKQVLDGFARADSKTQGAVAALLKLP